MAESESHKRAKCKAASRAGKTEAPLRGNRRLDAVTPRKATEIERSGAITGLEKAAKRLKDSGKPRNNAGSAEGYGWNQTETDGWRY